MIILRDQRFAVYSGVVVLKPLPGLQTWSGLYVPVVSTVAGVASVASVTRLLKVGF